ncbi:MAG: hypothetical protein U0269_14725 [Polyangiales bacterium]
MNTSTRIQFALVFSALVLSSPGCDKLRRRSGGDAPGASTQGAQPGSGFSLDNPSATLAALDSAGATQQRLVIGVRGSSARQSVYTRVRVAADRYRSELQSVDQDGAPVRSMYAREGRAVYMSHGDARCTGELRESDGSEAMANPLSLLPPVRNATEAGQETVSGEATRKYTFDQRSMTSNPAVQAQGTVWIAINGGWVVRYALRATDANGERAWEYTATRVGANTAVRPTDCGAVLEDIAAIEGATNVERTTGTLRYESAQPIAAARAFTGRSLQAQGYAQRMAVLETASEAMIVYEHGQTHRFALFAARAEGGATRVQIQVADPPSAAAVASAQAAAAQTPQPAPTLTPPVAALARYLPDALGAAQASDPPNGTSTAMFGMRTTMAMRTYHAGARSLRVMLSQGDVARMARSVITGAPTDRQAAAGVRQTAIARQPARLTVDGTRIQLQCVLDGGLMLDLHLEGATAAEFDELLGYANALDIAALRRVR